MALDNSDIKSIKFDQNIVEGEKFTVGGVHAANISLELLNYEGKWDDVNFDSKEFDIQIKLATEMLYTVEQFHREEVSVIDMLKIKHLTSLWIPIRKILFYRNA